MKKLLALLLALTMVFALCACGGQTQAPAEAPTEAPAEAPAEGVTSISLWTYPIGKWNDRRPVW